MIWLKQKLNAPDVKVLANEEFPFEIKCAFAKGEVSGPGAIVFNRKYRKNKTLSAANSTTKASTTHEEKTTRGKNILEQNLPQEIRNEGVKAVQPIEILTESVTGEFKLSRGK